MEKVEIVRVKDARTAHGGELRSGAKPLRETSRRQTRKGPDLRDRGSAHRVRSRNHQEPAERSPVWRGMLAIRDLSGLARLAQHGHELICQRAGKRHPNWLERFVAG